MTDMDDKLDRNGIGPAKIMDELPIEVSSRPALKCRISQSIDFQPAVSIEVHPADSVPVSILEADPSARFVKQSTRRSVVRRLDFSSVASLDSIEEQRPDLTSSVLFHGVIYLGSTSTTSPRSEEELHKYECRRAFCRSQSTFFQRNMTIINEQSQMAIEVTLCVPDNADGRVR
jgi:hypothetical protein